MPLFVCLVRLGILLYHLFICWFVGSFVHFFVCLFLFILHLFVCYLGDISCDDIEIGDPPLQLIVSLLFFLFCFCHFLFVYFVCYLGHVSCDNIEIGDPPLPGLLLDVLPLLVRVGQGLHPAAWEPRR